MKFLKILAAKLGAMRNAGKVAFSDPPPKSGTEDLVEDGFEPTDADPPTREELVDLGLVDLDIVETSMSSDRSDVLSPMLEGSLAARRYRREL